MASSLVRYLASRLGVPVALLASGLAGCAAYDDFSWKKMNFEVFRTPSEPMAVLRDPNSDGGAKRRALQAIREPASNGGSQAEQDLYVQVLSHTAAHDPNPDCRRAAIEVLSHFRDPRAVDGLKDAYYRAGSFQPEMASVLRRYALVGLGDTRQEAAVELLVRVLREPPIEGPDQDRDHKTQERLAAARALSHFQSYQATAALADAMAGKEEDIALQRRCHESLVAITGKEPGQDPKAWKEFLSSPGAKEAIANRRPTLGENLLQLTGFK